MYYQITITSYLQNSKVFYMKSSKLAIPSNLFWHEQEIIILSSIFKLLYNLTCLKSSFLTYWNSFSQIFNLLEQFFPKFRLKLIYIAITLNWSRCKLETCWRMERRTGTWRKSRNQLYIPQKTPTHGKYFSLTGQWKSVTLFPGDSLFSNQVFTARSLLFPLNWVLQKPANECTIHF